MFDFSLLIKWMCPFKEINANRLHFILVLIQYVCCYMSLNWPHVQDFPLPMAWDAGIGSSILNMTIGLDNGWMDVFKLHIDPSKTLGWHIYLSKTLTQGLDKILIRSKYIVSKHPIYKILGEKQIKWWVENPVMHAQEILHDLM